MWGNIKQSNKDVTGSPEEEQKGNRVEKVRVGKGQNLPKFGETMNIQIQ